MNPRRPNSPLFSRQPKVSVADVRQWVERLEQGDAAVKSELVGFIEHRLRGRYIIPLMHIVPSTFKSGFLIMASASLLIEALQTFREGKKDSESGSGATFIRVLCRTQGVFPQPKRHFSTGSREKQER